MKLKRITAFFTCAMMVFALLPNYALADSDGAIEADKTLVSSVTLPKSMEFDSGTAAVELPVTVSYSETAEGEGLKNLPIGISVNGTAAVRSGSAEDGYTYSAGEGSGALALAFDEVDTGAHLSISAADGIADGEYLISLDFPKEIMADGAKMSVSCTVTVGEKQTEAVYTIAASASPVEGGSVSGGGSFKEGESVTLTATANDGYTFAGWSENGSVIEGAGAVYTFSAATDRTLTAVFEQQSTGSDAAMEISIGELAEVPASLKGSYTSLEALKGDMLKKLKSGYTAKNTVFFDVKLKLTDDGKTWRDATVEDFPEGGITVEFLYSDIADKVGIGNSFMVTHMFTETSDRLGTVAGEMETPKVKKLKDRIQVTFNGLSPVSISWKRASSTSYGEAPVITFPVDDTRVLAAVGSAPTISVTAKNANNYQWQINISDNLWEWKNIDNATGSSFTLPRVQLNHDGYRYRCIVTNSYGSAISRTFTVRTALNLSDLPKTGGNPSGAVWSSIALIGAAAAVLALRKREK